MFKKLALGILIITSVVAMSCQEDMDDFITTSSNVEINDFVWKAMNVFYYFKSNVPDLADNRFSTNEEYSNYLSGFESPEALFSDLKVDEDRFSVIVEDYRVLEDNSIGISFQNGMRFGLVLIEDSNQVFGYVRYVVPNSPAETQGVERGMVFSEIDGIGITETNFIDLLSPTQYAIGLAELQDDQLVTTGQTITLTRTELTENPIHIATTLNINDQKIGYLMYNAFRSNFESQLNQVFAEFSADGITDLVLDLRYNGGGSVETAKDLSSMITGQFNGDLFAKLTYNENFDDVSIFFDDSTADGENINNLNLNTVFIITSSSSASASELVINALNPYINVVQVGTNTVGKFQGSQVLYDSDDFRKQNVNPGHFYALQPLIFEIENAEGFTGFEDGLEPDVPLQEDFFNLGILGDTSEPLLAITLQNIVFGLQEGGTTPVAERSNFNFKLLDESGSKTLDYQRMYFDKSDNLGE
jgi:C-terminal processing protease CtpA/Prc